jgi:hypothetical protein
MKIGPYRRTFVREWAIFSATSMPAGAGSTTYENGPYRRTFVREWAIFSARIQA